LEDEAEGLWRDFQAVLGTTRSECGCAIGGHFIAREPSPILALLPTEADCRDYMVCDSEPLFLR
jgi:hypothetical protein